MLLYMGTLWVVCMFELLTSNQSSGAISLLLIWICQIDEKSVDTDQQASADLDLHCV